MCFLVTGSNQQIILNTCMTAQTVLLQLPVFKGLSLCKWVTLFTTSLLRVSRSCMILFQFAICTAVSGHTALYGYISTYLGTIQITENVFVRGPAGCHIEGLQLYLRMCKCTEVLFNPISIGSMIVPLGASWCHWEHTLVHDCASYINHQI